MARNLEVKSNFRKKCAGGAKKNTKWSSQCQTLNTETNNSNCTNKCNSAQQKTYSVRCLKRRFIFVKKSQIIPKI